MALVVGLELVVRFWWFFKMGWGNFVVGWWRNYRFCSGGDAEIFVV
jgi:hypothetical protein